MKLRNKKTGVVIVFSDGIVDLARIGCKNVADMLEKGWEDYEEPKQGYWFIDYDGRIHKEDYAVEEEYKDMAEIGNYFGTKEEAGLAVQKLKAWKRLKDKGFKITLVQDGGYVYLQADWGLLLGDFSDVELLFGEED